eukprot:TRINITY_DN7320_c0_g1_i2.p2 TRINITY_DN7320_c0_g1~~TRINITY_DN7320_c0_g1_i2.p2  ORF type:complete len:115 (-),score=9.12 TRINITY_DN7320_c0_g1_i2:511-855(-)
MAEDDGRALRSQRSGQGAANRARFRHREHRNRYLRGDPLPALRLKAARIAVARPIRGRPEGPESGPSPDYFRPKAIFKFAYPADFVRKGLRESATPKSGDRVPQGTWGVCSSAP